MNKFTLLIGIGLLVAASHGHGGELNHYQPALSGTRDFFVPVVPGWYFSQSNFTSASDDFYDGDGESLRDISFGGTFNSTRTTDGSSGFSLYRERQTDYSVNFQGSRLDFGATLERATEMVASVSINAEATTRIRAETDVRATVEDIDLEISAISPSLVWVGEEKLMGARMAALISLPVVDLSLDAALKGRARFKAKLDGELTVNGLADVARGTTVSGTLTATGPRGDTVFSRGGSASLENSRNGSVTITDDFTGELDLQKDFEFNIREAGTALGDLYVQPLWLSWSGTHYDFSLADGFYVPTGQYSEGALDNTGMGFWSNQARAAAAWYPWESRGTAFTVAATHELHGNRKGVDITPGSNLTLNWGPSQFLPLNPEQTVLADVGFGGYHMWQVSDDRGSDVNYDAGVHDEVHALGLQVGIVDAEKNAALTFRWMHEVAARDRFMGDFFVLNFARKF